MKKKTSKIFVCLTFCFTFSVFGQTPSSEEARSMDLEEFSKRLREELKRADDPATEWNQMSEEEREKTRLLGELHLKKMRRRSELLEAHVLLPKEERIQNEEKFRKQMKQLDADYKAEKARIETSFSPNAKLPPLPDRQIDRWELLSLIHLDNQIHFSLHNPWEKLSFWANSGDEFHGIKITDWNESEQQLLIESEEESKWLAVGQRIKRSPSSETSEKRAAILEKYRNALVNIPGLLPLDDELEEIIPAKTALDKKFRNASHSSSELSPKEFLEHRNRLIHETDKLHARGSELIIEILQILENDNSFSPVELRTIRQDFWSRLAPLLE